MRKAAAVLTAGMLLTAVLGACGMERVGDLGNKNIRTNEAKYNSFGQLVRDKRFADDTRNEMHRLNGQSLNGNNLIGSHKNYHLEMSELVAEEVAKLEEVKSSYVMLTDASAYVAVSLDADLPQGDAKSMSRTMMGLSGREGTAASRRMSSLSTGQHKLTDELVSRIADIVKRMRPAAENVYVSADPEFVGRMNGYMNDVRLGYSIQPYLPEFNAMVERVFPYTGAERKYDPHGVGIRRLLD
jgi:Sporulation lipoprotein YhcN/YlaJ (Spore_YhcN_YlaJ).